MIWRRLSINSVMTGKGCGVCMRLSLNFGEEEECDSDKWDAVPLPVTQVPAFSRGNM